MSKRRLGPGDDDEEPKKPAKKKSNNPNGRPKGPETWQLTCLVPKKWKGFEDTKDLLKELAEEEGLKNGYMIARALAFYKLKREEKEY